MTGVTEQLAESRVAISNVVKNRSLRRLNLALTGSVIGDWALSVAMSVFAYQRGGVNALGALGVVRFVIMALLAPVMSVLADKIDRRRVMLGADVVRAVLVFATAAIVLADGPALPVYALSIIVSIVGLAFRPAQAAILPSLARTPSELTAANVVSSTINSVGFFVGPAIAGLLLAFTDIGVVFAFDGATFVWSAIMVFGVRPAASAATADAEEVVAEATADAVPGELALGMFAGTGDGFRVIRGNPDLRLIVGLYVAQTIVSGCGLVYEVAIALDLLGLEESGVGLLNAALGVGGMFGGALALVLSQRGRLSRDFGIGVALWAAPLLLVAAYPTVLSALVAMALIGIGNSIVDVNAETIIQRLVPDEMLGRVFGALEGAAIAGIALGAALMPILITTIGLRSGLVVIGVGTTAVVLVGIPGLMRIDRTTLAPDGVELFRGVPMLAVLPEHVIERLARTSEVVELRAGTTVFSEGDDGDRFYVIESGEVEVSRAHEPLATLSSGGSFGEIALLRAVPRTATVTTRTDVVARTIDRGQFLPAVTGHADATHQADLVVGRYMDIP